MSYRKMLQRPPKCVIEKNCSNDFISDIVPYYLPEYICTVSHLEGKIVFNLLVKDVYLSSTDIRTNHEAKTVNVKFSVVKVNPTWACHYAFTVKLPVLEIITCAIVTLTTSVVLTVYYTMEEDEDIESYMFGKSDADLRNTTIEPHQVLIEDDLDEDEDEGIEAEEVEEPEIETGEEWPTTEV